MKRYGTGMFSLCGLNLSSSESHALKGLWRQSQNQREGEEATRKAEGQQTRGVQDYGDCAIAQLKGGDPIRVTVSSMGETTVCFKR